MVKIKKVLGIAGLSTLLFLSPAIIDFFIDGYKLNKKSKIVSSLYVNTLNEFRTVCNKDEKSGVKDIESLVKHSSSEESWIYLPKQNKWLETGECEGDTLVDGDIHLFVNTDKKYVQKIIKENPNIIDYHFHPSYLTDEKLKNRIFERKPFYANPKNSLLLDNLIKKTKKNIFSKAGIPSKSDIRTMIKLTKENAKIHLRGDVKANHCSAYGITSTYLTNFGKRYFVSADSSLIETFLKTKDKSKILPICYDLKISGPDLTKKYARQLSDSFLIIDFKTYEEFYSNFDSTALHSN